MDSGKLRERLARVLAHATVVAVMISASGCPFIVPVHVQSGAPGEDVFRNIHPKVTTRTDVLLMLGDPDFRGGDDRYFVYHWQETHAVAGLVVPPGAPVSTTLGDWHALALEFGPDGRVVRFEQLSNDDVGVKHDERRVRKAEAVLWERIRAWMKATDAMPR